MTKLWGGRFRKSTAIEVERFNASIDFDQRLYHEDIQGSKAHAQMLAKQEIISSEEAQVILCGLDQIEKQIEAGEFEFKLELEDIHMNIEKALTDQIGEVGGKLHTARSRNDQVALDTHLYLRNQITDIGQLIVEMQKALLTIAEQEQETIFPGYTHLQRAQPISFAHHLLAYFFMLERDFQRIQSVYKGTNLMPLGAGALAGTTFPIAREQVAKELHFSALYENTLDAVSDRDYVIEFLSFSSILMMHLSRLSEEIILWNSTEFSFVELDDSYTTGSSIMPQKKNPDVSELVRGKTGRVYGNLFALLTTLKGLPLAYNKDMQEDKEGLFDSIDTIKFCLTVYPGLIRTMKVNRERIESLLQNDFSNATDMADYLVRQGLPFRKAHEVTGNAVRLSIDTGRVLTELTDQELQTFSELLQPDVRSFLDIAACVNRRNTRGGPGKDAILVAIEKGKEILKHQSTILDAWELSRV